MKILAVLAIMLISVSAGAAEVTLAWDANTEADLAGYKIYYGSASRVYENTITVDLTPQKVVTDLADGLVFFAVTAFDDQGNESGFSNEVSVDIDTIAPQVVVNVTATITGKITYTVTIE